MVTREASSTISSFRNSEKSMAQTGNTTAAAGSDYKSKKITGES